MNILCKKSSLSFLLFFFLILIVCAPISTAESIAYVQATDNASIQLTPNVTSKLLGVLFENETLEYLADISIDDQGVTWYKVLYQDDAAWISAKSSILCYSEEMTAEQMVQSDSASPLENHPGFFDGYIFEMTGSYQARLDGKIANGMNEHEIPVAWQLSIYRLMAGDEPDVFLSCPSPKLIFCSWSDNVCTYTDGQLDSAWDLIREGHTLQQTELLYHWPGEYEIHTYDTQIYMPDTPEIEGNQQLIYLIEDELLIFNFTLIYNGGYSGDGLGWSMTNVEFTRCSLE